MQPLAPASMVATITIVFSYRVNTAAESPDETSYTAVFALDIQVRRSGHNLPNNNTMPCQDWAGVDSTVGGSFEPT